MTVTIVYVDSGDGYLSSVSSSYSSARNGTGVTLHAATTTGFHGQKLDAGTYTVWQTFFAFSYSAVAATHRTVSAVVRVKMPTVNSASVARNLELYGYSWGASVDTADWRTPTDLAALPQWGFVYTINAAAGKYAMAGDVDLTEIVAGATTLRFVAVTSRQRAGNTPTVDESQAFYLAERAGTTEDAALIFTTMERNRLWPVLGAQVQLSDNSWAYLESDAAATPTVTLKHATTGGTVTTIATVPTGDGGTEFDVSDAAGAQALALVVDSSDHLYVLGKVGNAVNSLAAKGYVKGGGYTWSASTTRSWPLSSYDAMVNNVAGAYHPTGGGVIFTVFGHTAGVGVPGTGGNELAYAILDATYLRTGAGSLMRKHASAIGVVQLGTLASGAHNAYANEVGTGLDVVAAPSINTAWGYVYSFNATQVPGDNAGLHTGRYVINAAGTALEHASTQDPATWATKDATAKVRAVAVGASIVVAVSTDADAGWGISLDVLQHAGATPGAVLLGSAHFSDLGLTSMPDGPALAVAQWWDAIYDSVSNTVWIYYRDVANARVLKRTAFSVTTMLPVENEITVTTLASGTASIQAVRVARNKPVTGTGLVQLAVKDAAVYSLTNVIDSYNAAPTGPTLTPKANFDATAAATFAWTHNDPNPGDTQTAYELEVYDVADNSLDLDTGKVTSTTSSRNVTGGTLANSKSYRWRVRTWDTSDAQGAWSDYGTFSTSAGGTVTITDPASDNPAGVITDDYLIAWSVAGTTQAGYRVWLIRADTAATVADTGWVTSTATIYHVTGMLSGVEYRVEVKVRNASLVESGTGTRLITPDYGDPEVPIIDVVANDADGYVEIHVTNPAPSGDRPEVTTNVILRRVVGGSTYEVVGTCDPDTSFRDYRAPGGVPVEYVARGTA